MWLRRFTRQWIQTCVFLPALEEGFFREGLLSVILTLDAFGGGVSHVLIHPTYCVVLGAVLFAVLRPRTGEADWAALLVACPDAAAPCMVRPAVRLLASFVEGIVYGTMFIWHGWITAFAAHAAVNACALLVFLCSRYLEGLPDGRRARVQMTNLY